MRPAIAFFNVFWNIFVFGSCTRDAADFTAHNANAISVSSLSVAVKNSETPSLASPIPMVSIKWMSPKLSPFAACKGQEISTCSTAFAYVTFSSYAKKALSWPAIISSSLNIFGVCATNELYTL